MTGTDFLKLCDANGITVKFTSTIERGFYYCTEGKHYIAISSKLSPIRRSFISWHEFAHFLQNFHERKTIAAFSGVCPDRPGEKLADIFAMIALRPDEFRITGPQDFIHMIMTTDPDEETSRHRSNKP